MVTPGLGHWGLGLEIGGSPDNQHFGHGGDNDGFHGLFFAYEKDGEGAAVMTNGDQGVQLESEIMRAIATEYRWPDYGLIVRNEVAIDPAILPRYVGTYAITPQLDLNIAFESGRLAMQTVESGRQPGGFKSRVSPLYAESDSKFFFLDSPAEIEFVANSAGQTEYLLVHEGGETHKAVRK